MSLKITLLGTGVGIPQPGRSQAAILLEDDMPLLLDCGAGTLIRLDQVGVDMDRIDTVLLSHLHLDHVNDLMAIANGRYLSDLPGLSIYGPEGTRRWFETVLSLYPNLEKMKFDVQEVAPMDSFSLKGFDIFAEETRHSVATLAYRLEDGEKTVVYSGDTEPSARVAALADGADLLIHECSFPEPFDVTNHTTPMKLGHLLRNKNLKRVILTHLYPQTEGHEDEMAEQVIKLCGVPTIVGWDMLMMEI